IQLPTLPSAHPRGAGTRHFRCHSERERGRRWRRQHASEEHLARASRCRGQYPEDRQGRDQGMIERRGGGMVSVNVTNITFRATERELWEGLRSAGLAVREVRMPRTGEQHRGYARLSTWTAG